MFNWMKTAILMAGIMALFGAVGSVIGGQQGMLMALAFGAVVSVAILAATQLLRKARNSSSVD